MAAKRKKTCTYIGGQAVLEGVMMMGKTCMATAVRDSDGEIQIEARRINKSGRMRVVNKIPLVRGIVNLVLSLVRGTKTLTRSAAVFGEDGEGESGKFERWLADKLRINLMDVITFVSVLLGVVLAVGIFVVLPRFLTGLITPLKDTVWEYVLLGVFKLIIFIGYLALILLMKDIRRLYQYHGAEHKTINAYEQGVELTPENVQQCTRIHDRCGTSFLFIVLFINIFVISLASWAFTTYVYNAPVTAVRIIINVCIELVLLPVIAGISYEILKLLAKFDNKFVNFFKAPGKLLQKKLTTREPDPEMLEVAIAAFNKVLEMDADPDVPETEFVTGGVLSKMLDDTKKQFAEKGIDGSDAEWIYSIVLGIHRSDLGKGGMVSLSEGKRIRRIVQERLTGRPLWYIIGDTDFYGCKIKVDERALIPRPETEILAESVAKSAENGYKILDLCTGSGCIAVSVAKQCRLEGKNVSVTAADISDAALMLAKENAELNGVNVSLVRSDLFNSVRGRYNIIVCNPPYVKSGELPLLQREVREFEPEIALDGGKDGLDFYRAIAKDIKSYIARDGMLMLECGEGQAGEILNMFRKRDYAMIMKDFSGADRFIKIFF